MHCTTFCSIHWYIEVLAGWIHNKIIITWIYTKESCVLCCVVLSCAVLCYVLWCVVWAVLCRELHVQSMLSCAVSCGLNWAVLQAVQCCELHVLSWAVSCVCLYAVLWATSGADLALWIEKTHERQSDCSILFSSNIKITDLKMIKFKLREFLHQWDK